MSTYTATADYTVPTTIAVGDEVIVHRVSHVVTAVISGLAQAKTSTGSQVFLQLDTDHVSVRIGRQSKVVHKGFAVGTHFYTACNTKGGRYGLGVARKVTGPVTCSKCLNKG